ncbi:hypothetical protein ABT095_07130 [Kitasatospora sp. NPDC002227]|uniref:hypothetical protein n=1 Tax=Kitasatospora sp. NPDC002227 TaxID=3154773 RepID=UPI00332D86DD
MPKPAALSRLAAILALVVLGLLGTQSLAAPVSGTAVAGPQLPQNSDSGWGP